jgi:hypothetical protein
MSDFREWGVPTTSSCCGVGKNWFPPNALRFCCGGLRRPPPSQQTCPAAGRRAQAPVSSKRGLGCNEVDRIPRASPRLEPKV